MLLVLTVVLSLLSVTQSCSPLVSDRKVLRTSLSVNNGAHYLKSGTEYNATLCFAGCCTLKDCDTAMHTGIKVTTRGTNCFYFKCAGHCLYNSSTNNNIQVATFPLYTSPLPETPDETQPSFEPEENVTLVLDGSDTSATGYQIGEHTAVQDTTNNKTKSETQKDTTNNEAQSETQKTSSLIFPPVIVTNATVHINTTKSSETSLDKTAKIIPEDKPDLIVVTEPQPKPEPKVVITESKEEAEKEEPKKEEPQREDIKLNKPEKEEPKNEESDSKPTEVVKDKLPNEVPALLKPTVNESGEENSNLKIEVDIINHEDNVRGGFVFWVALVLGTCLVSFGLIIVCRCYTKKRRLYSALADDYLINGMYSI